MAHRRIGQESFGFGVEPQRVGCLNDLSCMIDWSEIDRLLEGCLCAAHGRGGVAAPGVVQGAVAFGLVRFVGRETGRSAR